MLGFRAQGLTYAFPSLRRLRQYALRMRFHGGLYLLQQFVSAQGRKAVQTLNPKPLTPNPYNTVKSL